MATYRVVRLLEPTLCLTCRFADVVRVEQDGRVKDMFRCTRDDCDNHINDEQNTNKVK